MASQGAVTQAVVAALTAAGWSVLYRCLPNTAHIGVVPIPTPTGAGNQRYPDVVALRDGVLRLIEVEHRLSEDVGNDISLRFAEMRTSLADKEVWIPWRRRISDSSGVAVPKVCRVEAELVVIAPISVEAAGIEARLRGERVTVTVARAFVG